MKKYLDVLVIWVLMTALALAQHSGLKAVARVTGQATLNGSLSYDPNPGGRITSYKWSKVSGGACTIVYPDSVKTPVHGLSKGIYIFKLTVPSSEKLKASAETTVTVKIN